MKRIVDMGRELPGGRVRIHWFVFSETGAARTSKGKLKSSGGEIEVVGRMGYIACDPKRTSLNPSRDGEIIKTFHHTDEPRAATCPECLATAEYKAAMQSIEGEQVQAKIHWFKRDEGKPARATGHLACEASRQIDLLNPPPDLLHASEKSMSDDPRAATCDECRLSDEYAAEMAELDRLERIRTA